MNGAEKTFTAHCNACLQETNHRVLAEKKRAFEDAELQGVIWEDKYRMIECCGCESISFHLEEFFSEAVNIGDPGTRITRYPPAVKRKGPKWSDQISEPLRGLLDEVYVACANDARTVAAMGMRAIVDAVANDKVGDLGPFKRKLEALVAGEFISSYQMEIVDAGFDAGSAAMHRAFRSDVQQIDRLLDIVEHLLQGTYVLRDVARDVKQVTPKRNKDE